MTSPCMARGLLRHFPCGTDPPAVYQHISPPPVWSPTSSSLRAILAAGARVGGAQGGEGGCRSPLESGGGGREAGGRSRGRRGMRGGGPEATTKIVERTATHEIKGGGRQQDIYDTPAGIDGINPFSITTK